MRSYSGGGRWIVFGGGSAEDGERQGRMCAEASSAGCLCAFRKKATLLRRAISPAVFPERPRRVRHARRKGIPNDRSRCRRRHVRLAEAHYAALRGDAKRFHAILRAESLVDRAQVRLDRVFAHEHPLADLLVA